MADYVYRISSSGTAAGANAGFTTIAAAISDFKANNRMGAGAGVVPASSNVAFKVDGFLNASSGCDMFGFDVSASGAGVIVDSWGAAFDSTPRALGASSLYDGLDFGGFANMLAGSYGSRQSKLVVRNLVLYGASSGNGVIEAFGPTDGSSNVLIDRCLLRNSHATAGRLITLDACDMRNSVLIAAGSGATIITNIGRTGGNRLDHITAVCLGGGATFVSNSNDPLPTLRNSYVGGVTTMVSGGGTWPGGNAGNATSAASGLGGSLFNVALDTTNFTSVTAGSEDLRVKSGSVLTTTGAARLAGVTTDIFGTARADPATIGAYEYTAPAVALGGGVTLDDALPAGGFSMVASNGFGGAITLDDALPGGGFSIGVSFGGAVTLDDTTPSGGFTIAPKAVTTLPISRNTGSRPTGLSGIAVAVLSDDANLTRYAGATSIAQNPDGTVTFTSASLPAPGSSVLVVTRESDGKPGVWRYTVA